MPNLFNSLKQLTDYIDVRIAVRWDDITAMQTAYLTKHGHYFQGLPTHTQLPKDGVPTAPDQLALKPQREVVSWDKLDILPEKMVSSLRCDSYLSPAGPGYVLTWEIEFRDNKYYRAINVGPEVRRDSGGWKRR